MVKNIGSTPRHCHLGGTWGLTTLGFKIIYLLFLEIALAVLHTKNGRISTNWVTPSYQWGETSQPQLNIYLITFAIPFHSKDKNPKNQRVTNLLYSEIPHRVKSCFTGVT